MVGYALSRLQFRGRNIVFYIIIFTMTLPFQITLIPQYILIVKMGWANTYYALIVPYLVSTLGILLFRQYFMSIPQDLIDAARIDGCGELQILFRILWPNSVPALVTVGILTFMTAWNEVLWPLIVIRTEEAMTMPQMVTLFAVGGRAESQLGTKLAAAATLAIPVLLTYSFFQRYLLFPDMTRVVCEFFKPGSKDRIRRIAQRVADLDPKQADQELNTLLRDFSARHKNFTRIIEYHYQKIGDVLKSEFGFSDTQKQLLGAYCSREYSFESAALMNPSIVKAPNENGFIISLRQVGEGHISSVGFRSIKIDKKGEVIAEETISYAILPQLEILKNEIILRFPDDSKISERILFPVTSDECNGIEDARFVKFEDDMYYATYTAYDGHKISIKLLMTKDFVEFRSKKFQGKAVNNKGMALFPEKIGDKYAMIARMDGENLYYMTSGYIDKWKNAELLDRPNEPWEFVQIGNCGSPIRTNQGWILLTHGVGPMRQYAIGACLLDLTIPTKIIGRLKNPLIIPNDHEREGYVPNVVYSCGGTIHDQDLIIPYAMSDYRSGFASIVIEELLNAFV